MTAFSHKKIKKTYYILVSIFLVVSVLSFFSSPLFLSKKLSTSTNAAVTTGSPFVSSTTTFSGWQKENLIDGQVGFNQSWSSALHTDSSHIEWAAFDLGGIFSVSKLSVRPSPNVSTFPIDFTIQYSTDLTNWIDIPIHRYTNYPARTNQNAVDFSFIPIQARGMRIYATKLGKDTTNNYVFQLGEMSITSAPADLRLYSSMDDAFDARMTNYYQQFALAKNQKNYRCAGTEIGATLTWDIGYSGEGSAYLSKFSWDESLYKNELLRMLLELPIDPNGLVWNTVAVKTHLDNHLLYESNAHYILSAWEYLKWSGNKNAFAQINDRALIVKASDNTQPINNTSCEYTQRVGIFHTIGQKFTSSKPISEIKMYLLAIGNADGTPIKKCENLTDPACSDLTNYQVTITNSSGTVVHDKKYAGIDKCNDGDCNTPKGWLIIPVNLSSGTYHIDLKNLGRIDVNPARKTSGDYYLSPLGWCSQFSNSYGDAADTSQNVATINGVATSVLSKLRKAMEFQTNIMKGNNGILIIDDSVPNGSIHKGRPSFQPFFQTQDTPSNFWDLVRFGYKDAYINTFYYGSLDAMAGIEEMAGYPQQATTYRNLMNTVKTSYNTEFWSSSTGRYISNIDVDGLKQDIGHTPQNLLAVFYGLADTTKGQSIMNWLNGNRTVATDTSTGADIYAFTFAPRTNTRSIESVRTASGIWFIGDNRPGFTNPETWIWNFKPDGSGTANFGNMEENGGSDLFFSYYDVVNRSRILGADNAWGRFKTIIGEFNKDGFYRRTGDLACTYKKHMLAGPESGLPAISFQDAFLGFNATKDGLVIKPNLPQELTFGGVNRVHHWGYIYDIEVNRSITTPKIEKLSELEPHYKVSIPSNKTVTIANGTLKNDPSTPTPNPSCPRKIQGDADCDGDITTLDFICWKGEYVNKIKLKNCFSSDFDTRDPVGILDYVVWVKYYQLKK